MIHLTSVVTFDPIWFFFVVVPKWLRPAGWLVGLLPRDNLKSQNAWNILWPYFVVTHTHTTIFRAGPTETILWLVVFFSLHLGFNLEFMFSEFRRMRQFFSCVRSAVGRRCCYSVMSRRVVALKIYETMWSNLHHTEKIHKTQVNKINKFD